MDEMTKNVRNRQVREQTNTQYGTRPTFRSPIQSEFHVIWVIFISALEKPGFSWKEKSRLTAQTVV